MGIKRTFESVIFLQGDDYNEFETTADLDTGNSSDPFWPGLYRGTREWTDQAFAYLMQWEDGEGREESTGDGVPWGGGDDTAFYDGWGKPAAEDVVMAHGGYVMSWHTGLSHAGLYRVSVVEDADAGDSERGCGCADGCLC